MNSSGFYLFVVFMHCVLIAKIAVTGIDSETENAMIDTSRELE